MRLALTALLSWIVVLLWVPASHADVRAGWAWQAQRNAAPNLGAVSGIPAGDLAVAWFGQPDKLALLGIGGAGTPSFAGATLVLAMDPDGPNLETEAAQIRACVIVLPWEPAAPMAWDAKPATVCDDSAPGRYDASADAFTFALGPLADALASAAVHGISIEPVDAPDGPFQVVFKGGDGVALRLATPPSAQTHPDAVPAPDTVEVGSDLEDYAPPQEFRASVPVGSSPVQNAPPPSSALAVAAPPRSESRPVSLSAVYGMLALLAGLTLGGRVVAYVLRSRREDEQ